MGADEARGIVIICTDDGHSKLQHEIMITVDSLTVRLGYFNVHGHLISRVSSTDVLAICFNIEYYISQLFISQIEGQWQNLQKSAVCVCVYSYKQCTHSTQLPD